MADQIRVVQNEALQAGPATAGMVRSTAIAAEGVWVGEVHTAANSVSGWHHHGEHTTYGRVLGGKLRFEFGADGRQVIEATKGDFFVVPPHFVHREGNPAAEEQVLVAVRIGSGPTVVNVEGPA